MDGRLLLDDLHLADYKWDPPRRGGDGGHDRVLITFSDAGREYTTVGVDANIIQASWKAMQDAYDSSLRAKRVTPSVRPLDSVALGRCGTRPAAATSR